jgi:predicted metalloprotease
MRLDDIEESKDVEDRTSRSGNSRSLGSGSIGVGSIVIALVVSYFLGVNPLTVLDAISDSNSNQSSQVQQSSNNRSNSVDNTSADNSPEKVRMKKVLTSTAKVWTEIFAQTGLTYEKPVLVLFSRKTPTPCGLGESATGPFYCPADSKIYIDLTFFDTLHQELGAPGDFAQAYVLAHEVGHHVQNITGINDRVDQLSAKLNEKQQNALSVRVELQADCYAGIWAKYANERNKILEEGDIEEAMNAAEKIGDDALQRAEQGEVVPDSFTHGTSAQRMRWYNIGFQSGKMQSCDTFKAKSI